MNVNLSPASVDIAGLAKYFLRDMQMVSASQLDSCFVSFSTASSHTEPPPPKIYSTNSTSWDILWLSAHVPSSQQWTPLHNALMWPTISPLPGTFLGCVAIPASHHICTPNHGFRNLLERGVGGWAWQPCWRFLVLWERPLGRENQFGRSWDCTSYMAPLCNGHLGAHMETSWSTDSFKRNYNNFSEKISRNFDICELLYRFHQYLISR